MCWTQSRVVCIKENVNGWHSKVLSPCVFCVLVVIESLGSSWIDRVLLFWRFFSPLPKLVLTLAVQGGGWPAGEARSQGGGGSLCSPTLLFRKEKAALIQASRAMPKNLMTIVLLAFKNPFYHFLFFPISLPCYYRPGLHDQKMLNPFGQVCQTGD